VTIVLASTGKVLPVGAPSTDTRTEVESGTTGTDIGTVTSVLVLVHIVRYSSTRTDSACTRRNLYYY
jgi:hypothetical protein